MDGIRYHRKLCIPLPAESPAPEPQLTVVPLCTQAGARSIAVGAYNPTGVALTATLTLIDGTAVWATTTLGISATGVVSPPTDSVFSCVGMVAATITVVVQIEGCEPEACAPATIGPLTWPCTVRSLAIHESPTPTLVPTVAGRRYVVNLVGSGGSGVMFPYGGNQTGAGGAGGGAACYSFVGDGQPLTIVCTRGAKVTAKQAVSGAIVGVYPGADGALGGPAPGGTYDVTAPASFTLVSGANGGPGGYSVPGSTRGAGGGGAASVTTDGGAGGEFDRNNQEGYPGGGGGGFANYSIVEQDNRVGGGGGVGFGTPVVGAGGTEDSPGGGAGDTFGTAGADTGAGGLYGGGGAATFGTAAGGAPGYVLLTWT